MISVDIVIPVHSPERPIARAVESVVREGLANVRAIVVCHNVERSVITAALGGLAKHDAVLLLEHSDGIRSPAGPRNWGIAASSAEYLGFLDSDDELEVGALEHWLRELGAAPDLLIGQMRSGPAGRILAPAPRPGRFARLTSTRDLLNYRTAPVGVLVRRRLVSAPESPGYRDGFLIGEDIALGLFLWNSANTIVYSRASAAYRIHDSGTDRVTNAPLPMGEILAPVRDAVALPSLRSLTRRQRQAISVKLLRHQVVERLRAHHSVAPVPQKDLTVAAATIADLLEFAPGVRGYLSRSEAALVDAISAAEPESFALALLNASNVHYRQKMVALNPLKSFAPESFYVRARRTRAWSSYFARVGGASPASNAENSV